MTALAACGAPATKGQGRCGTSAGDAAVAQARASEPYDLPPLTGRVVDGADLLATSEEAALTERLAALEQAKGHQLVVVTIRSLGGHAIQDYGLTLGNRWEIGRRDHDDGVLLVVAPNERKVRIEVGCGLEAALSDDEAKAIIDDAILPQFQAGDFPRGIAAGVDGIINEIGPVTVQ